MCTIRIKRTNSGNFNPSITRGELNYDYFTNTLFVGTGNGTAVPIAREIYGETGANLFLEAYDEAWPTTESAKAYIDSILGQYDTAPVEYEYLGITANRQTLVSDEGTDTVISWSSATIYEQTDNVGIKIYDSNDILPDYQGFFQNEVDMMYVRVTYSLLFSDIGKVLSGNFTADDYENSCRFAAIKLIDRFDSSTATYYGVQKVPPLTISRNSLFTSNRRSTLVSGVGIVPLPRRTETNPWEIQIVVRAKTTAPPDILSVGGFTDQIIQEDNTDFRRFERKVFGGLGNTNGKGINVQLQRLYS